MSAASSRRKQFLGISHFLNTGTCASGGPYAIEDQCPKNDIWEILLVPGFLAWMTGMFASKGGFIVPGAGLIVWTAGFLLPGVGLLIKAATNHSLSSGSYLAIFIMAGIFIPLGVGPGIAIVVQRSRARRASTP